VSPSCSGSISSRSAGLDRDRAPARVPRADSDRNLGLGVFKEPIRRRLWLALVLALAGLSLVVEV
jgi:hypothetical protein